MPTPGPLTIPSLDDLLTGVQNGVVEIASRVSAGASALYATLLATADFINAGLITLPAYDISLFIDGIKHTIIVVQVAVWLEGIFAAITGCGPTAPTAGL